MIATLLVLEVTREGNLCVLVCELMPAETRPNSCRRLGIGMGKRNRSGLMGPTLEEGEICDPLMNQCFGNGNMRDSTESCGRCSASCLEIFPTTEIFREYTFHFNRSLEIYLVPPQISQ